MVKEEQTRILVDTLNSEQIRKDSSEEFDSKLSESIERSRKKLEDSGVHGFEKAGDGFNGIVENLFTTVLASLEVVSINKKNSVRVMSKEKQGYYRLEQRILIHTQVIDEDVDWNPVLAALARIERAANYPGNSVILSDSAFHAIKDSLEREDIGWIERSVDPKNGHISKVYLIHHKEEGVPPVKQIPEIEEENKVLREHIEEIQERLKEIKQNWRKQKNISIILIIVSAVLITSLVVLVYNLEYTTQESKEQEREFYSLIINSHIREEMIHAINTMHTTVEKGTFKKTLKDVKIEDMSEKIIQCTNESQNLLCSDLKPMSELKNIYSFIALFDPNGDYHCPIYMIIDEEIPEVSSDYPNEWCDREWSQSGSKILLTSKYGSRGAPEFVNSLVYKFQDESGREWVLVTAYDFNELINNSRNLEKFQENEGIIILDHKNCLAGYFVSSKILPYDKGVYYFKDNKVEFEESNDRRLNCSPDHEMDIPSKGKINTDVPQIGGMEYTTMSMEDIEREDLSIPPPGKEYFVFQDWKLLILQD